MKRRKPLNIREAADLAQQHMGCRGGVRIQRTVTGGGYLATYTESRQIIELRHVGYLVVHGEHPTSWRKAFEAAGIFNV